MHWPWNWWVSQRFSKSLRRWAGSSHFHFFIFIQKMKGDGGDRLHNHVQSFLHTVGTSSFCLLFVTHSSHLDLWLWQDSSQVHKLSKHWFCFLHGDFCVAQQEQVPVVLFTWKGAACLTVCWKDIFTHYKFYNKVKQSVSIKDMIQHTCAHTIPEKKKVFLT